MKIGIVGTGYVGLVTGVCLSAIGHTVYCVDNDREKIKKLKKGIATIYEPGLQELMSRQIKKKKLFFCDTIREASKEALVIFIAVGTPSKKNGDADLTYVENVARQIAMNMDSYKLIVEKSTVPAETGKRIEHTVKLNLPGKFQKQGRSVPFDVASNPEFLREGSAIADFMNPDRVVIGVESRKAEELLKEIYKPLKTKIIVTNMTSAEIIKHASNSFLAAKISFANAVSQICDRVGADILKVTEGMGYDKRIGPAFLNAGVGFGGSCFPKDVDAFIRLSEKSGYDFHLLKAVRQVNEEQKAYFVRLVEDKLWILKDKTIGVLGLAFKPDTDDMRNAPSVDIISRFQSEGARIKVYDPKAMAQAKKILKNVEFCEDVYAVSKNSDCLVILTEWENFRQVDFQRIKKSMRQPVIFDGRNLFKNDCLADSGFEYYGIGRGMGK